MTPQEARMKLLINKMRSKCVKRLLLFFGKNHLRRKFFYGRLNPADCKLELIGEVLE